MRLLRGILQGRIVLDIDARETLLGGREQFMLVVKVVFPVLEENAVELAASDLAGRNVVNPLAERKRRASAPIAGRVAGLHRQEEMMAGPCQIPEVVAVDVPGENLQSPHIPPTNRLVPDASAARAKPDRRAPVLRAEQLDRPPGDFFDGQLVSARESDREDDVIAWPALDRPHHHLVATPIQRCPARRVRLTIDPLPCICTTQSSRSD